MSLIPRPELLAPAGNFEKLEIAIHYGADAVYLAGKDFSLRNFSGNFTIEELYRAVELAHARHVKVYVACNIYSRNHEQQDVTCYLAQLADINPDAVIIADPGILMEARRVIPGIPVHMSTQANTTNYRSALFWKNLGARRINAARELTLDEIIEIASMGSIEVEAFVHGAMCISYSGRCLLSSFMENRDANRGMCCHPCRFNYAVMEAKRPGQYYPLAEDDRGSYVFNSHDLCMIGHIPEMVRAGIAAFKIEGRMKGINYLASTVKVYREAIDSFCNDPEGYATQPEWVSELNSISNRGYCTGFYFGDPRQVVPNYLDTGNTAHTFLAKVTGESTGHAVSVQVRNKLFMGDRVEIIRPDGPV
ncbi:MAG: U32 family peptidase, partial [Deltaproteobacteria bacterium]